MADMWPIEKVWEITKDKVGNTPWREVDNGVWWHLSPSSWQKRQISLRKKNAESFKIVIYIYTYIQTVLENIFKGTNFKNGFQIIEYLP